jgi:hypothetical protein
MRDALPLPAASDLLLTGNQQPLTLMLPADEVR